MPLYLLCLLAIVQGITEFLPISSSAHLILVHYFSGYNADGLALDVAVHMGSVVAVLIYLRAEVAKCFVGLWDLLRGRTGTDAARLASCLILVTIPTLIFGAVLAITGVIDHLRSPVVIGVTMIVFGIWLYWAHKNSPEEREMADWNLKDVTKMGLWQAVALIPGTSRSGITMTVARLLNFKRHAAAKISMLMSIPVTLSTGGYLGIKIAKEGIEQGAWGDIALAAFLSFVAAYIALHLMMKFLDKVSFTPYVVYRIVLGVALLAVTAF